MGRVGREPVPRQIRLSSVLPVSYRPELERILFFNPEQDHVTIPLVASVRRYGVPETVERDQQVRFKLRAFGEVQSLFALDDTEKAPRLAGVVIFTRESTDSMLLVHLAVHPDYTHHGEHEKAGVTGRLLGAVRKLSLRVRGVETLRTLYPRKTRMVLHPRPAEATYSRRTKTV